MRLQKQNSDTWGQLFPLGGLTYEQTKTDQDLKDRKENRKDVETEAMRKEREGTN